jgi:cyclopropane fatty-acyl-phospholipid synthase-like methyltransferase
MHANMGEAGKEAAEMQFAELSFEDFRRMAIDASLSQHEKVGFPDSYREGFEDAIFADILHKLPALRERSKHVLEVGPGCSDLPRMLIELCEQNGHSLVLMDSAEMLAQLPDGARLTKVSGYYPESLGDREDLDGAIDAMLAYSVLHYVFAEGNLWRFIDRSIELLAPGGQFLIGDVPNVSKRKRFFASAAGIEHHKRFTGTDEMPEVRFNAPEQDRIDDAVVVAVLQRARAAGCDAYVLPQDPRLSMANRREDILLVKP